MRKTVTLTFFIKIRTGITGKIRTYIYHSPEATQVLLNVPKTTGCPVITYTCYISQIIHIHTLTYAIVCSRKGNVLKIPFLPRGRFDLRMLGHC